MQLPLSHRPFFVLSTVVRPAAVRGMSWPASPFAFTSPLAGLNPVSRTTERSHDRDALPLVAREPAIGGAAAGAIASSAIRPGHLACAEVELFHVKHERRSHSVDDRSVEPLLTLLLH